jgi:hypothetical protein
MSEAVATKREIEFACGDCGETFVRIVEADEVLTDVQLACPVRGCEGEGREL